MAKKRKTRNQRRAELRAGQRPFERVHIIDPDGCGRVAIRTCDTITLLFNRGQINSHQRAAAETYRDAVYACSGSIPCALDQTRVSSGNISSCPTENQLTAARTLVDAARILGLLDGKIVYMICVEGHGIEETAAKLLVNGAEGKPSHRDSSHIGKRLRLALQTLADVWWPERPTKPRSVAHRAAYSEQAQQPSGQYNVVPGHVAHCTRHKIYGL